MTTSSVIRFAVVATALGAFGEAAAQGTTPAAPALPLATAVRMAEASNAACRAEGFAVTTTVVDASGAVVATLRDDGASFVTPEVAKGKAYAAAGFRAPTDQLRDAARDNPGFVTVPGFVLLGGGLPVTVGGNVVGAIGVSGAPSDETDKVCAQAGLDAMGSGSSPGTGAPSGRPSRP